MHVAYNGLLDARGSTLRLPTRRSWLHIALSFFVVVNLSLLWLHKGARESAKAVYNGLTGSEAKTSGGFILGGQPGYDPAPQPYPVNDKKDSIPNQVHFVYALADPTADFHFHFRHFLSVYSTYYHWKPHTIWLHTNADQGSLERARNGSSGKWTASIFNMPGFRLNPMPAPVEAGNGMALTEREHVSDLMRVRAVLEYGGTYIDFDVVALRDIAVLRRAGFRGICGRQANGELNSGTFMAAAGRALIAGWWAAMNRLYNGSWTAHSNGALTAVATALVRDSPGEALIMERDAFAPLGWMPEDNLEIFGIHDDAPSPLAAPDLASPPRLPAFAERGPDEPTWARDWSASYMLHAFKPARNGDPVPGFRHVTPRYVLSRQSNYARATYPVVRDMLHRGLVNIDDAYDA